MGANRKLVIDDGGWDPEIKYQKKIVLQENHGFYHRSMFILWLNSLLHGEDFSWTGKITICD